MLSRIRSKRKYLHDFPLKTSLENNETAPTIKQQNLELLKVSINYRQYNFLR